MSTISNSTSITNSTSVLASIKERGADSFKGTFGHFTVVTATKPSSELAASTSTTTEIGTYYKDVSIWDRIVNWFTGKLDREKNQAIIGFIATGITKDYSEGLGETLLDTSSPLERLDVFKKFMTGRSNATLDEKKQACEALQMLIDGMSQDERNEFKNDFSNVFKGLMRNNTSGDLGAKLLHLDAYINTERYPDNNSLKVEGDGLDDTVMKRDHAYVKEDYDEEEDYDDSVMKVDHASVDKYDDESGHLKSGERVVLVESHITGEDGGFHEISEKEAVAEIEKLQAQQAESKAKKK